MNSLPTFRYFVFAALFVLGFRGTCSADQKYRIQFKFLPESQLRYLSSQTVTQTAATAAGQKADTSKVDQTRVFTVHQVDDDGAADVSMQFESVRMEIQSDQGVPEVFDSKLPPSSVPKKFQHVARKLSGAAPRYTLPATGTPISVEGIEEVPEGGQASFMMPLPDHEVSVGDSWKANMKCTTRIAEGVLREVLLLRTYRLESVEQKVATISFATSLVSPIKSPTVKAQLLQATPLGTITFDLENGTVLKRVLRFDKSVLGALGPNTMLSVVGQIEETLIANESDESTVTSR